MLILGLNCIATVGFSLESANVVGYADSVARSGFKALGAQFVGVSAATIDLTDLKVTGYDAEEGTEGDVYVQGLDATGKGTGSYFYYDVPGELTGWLNGDDELVEAGTVMLSPGDGFWVSAPNNSFGIQSAGTVPTSDISVVLRSGFKLAVNSTPVVADLSDIVVTGYDAEEGTEGDVYVQGLDATGNGTGSYFYYDVPGEITGWLDGNDEEVEVGQVYVNPGDVPSSAAYSLVFPGVTL